MNDFDLLRSELQKNRQSTDRLYTALKEVHEELKTIARNQIGIAQNNQRLMRELKEELKCRTPLRELPTASQ